MSIVFDKFDKEKLYQWSYKPFVTDEPFYGTQEDWNQTLMSKINMTTSVDKHGKNLKDGDVFLTPKKFKPLLESIMFYDNEKQVYTSPFGEFKFEFEDRDDNFLFVIDEKVKDIENNPYKYKIALEIIDFE